MLGRLVAKANESIWTGFKFKYIITTARESVYHIPEKTGLGMPRLAPTGAGARDSTTIS